MTNQDKEICAFYVIGSIIGAGIIIIFALIFVPQSHGQEILLAEINLEAIKMIESNGNPKAYNKISHARGLFQITPICLADWNQYHKNEQYTIDDLWSPQVNEKIARWYITIRIPQLLKHYNQELTIENIITAWNWGIAHVGKPPCPEVKDFLVKYYNMN